MLIKTRQKKWLLHLLWVLPLLLLLANFFLQSVWAHRDGPFRPDYPRLDLTAILGAEVLSRADYDTLFLQTGLAPAAIDDLRALGEPGVAYIAEVQDYFFAETEADCLPLSPITLEERMYDEEGFLRMAVPLAPLRDGDILLTFSTHTFGWRHGHAGLVVDAAHNLSLEAVVLGSNSAQGDLRHWSSYSTLLVLRLKDAPEGLSEELVDFALAHLEDIPYRLTAGVFGEKALDPAGDLGAQCAYLPWYAYMQLGYDLDSDGGRVVTVHDLSRSDLLEVVQVFGLDPRLYVAQMN